MKERSLLEIKRRISSIKSTQKITKAMELISISKLRYAKTLFENNKEYFSSIDDLKNKVSYIGKSERCILKEEGQGKDIFFIVIGSDSGLCGSFNGQGLEYVNRCYKEEEKKVITIGSRTLSYVKKYNLDLYKTYKCSENTKFEKVKEIVEEIIKLYKNGEIKEVRLVYSKYFSSVKQEVTDEKLLPFDEEVKEEKDVYSINGNEIVLLEGIVENYIESKIVNSILNAKISEESLRMQAMNSASKNADEIIKSLSIRYNQIRQGNITKEISEIVSGAKAQG